MSPGKLPLKEQEDSAALAGFVVEMVAQPHQRDKEQAVGALEPAEHTERPD